MEDAYQVIIIIILYVIGAIIQKVAKGKQDKDMMELAQRLSLEYVEGNIARAPKIAGAYEGRDVMIENVVRSRGRDQRMFYRVIMRSDVSIPDSIRVHNSASFGPVTDLFSEIGEFFGIHDIPFDNSVFDEKFTIRGRNEALVKQIIDESVQEALINIGRVNLVVQDDEIIYESDGNAPENESKIRSILAFEDRIAARTSELAASDDMKAGVAEAPKPQFQAKKAPPVAAKQQEVRSAMAGSQGVVIRAMGADIVADRSDYYPVAPFPEQLQQQLRREGYYGGD